MNLIIVESPTKAKTLSRFLGSDYQIEATMGHLRDLPSQKLSIEIKKKKEGQSYDFLPDYALIPKKKETIDKLVKDAPKAGQVILATDPDREGEAIAWHVSKILPINTKTPNKYQRIVFHEITESAIKEALKNPREIDLHLVDAQQARRILDRLVGYKLSPLLWRKIRRGLSAGRVQSVAVRLIVEREREIQAFKAEEYWTIQAELISDKVGADVGTKIFSGSKSLADVALTVKQSIAARNETLKNFVPPRAITKNSFLANLVSQDEKKLEIKNKEQAEQIVADLQKLTYQVKEIKINDALRHPYPPFTTSTMQQAAAVLFGWTSKRTMQVAQSLYEQGLITYHRTDSLNLAQLAVSACRDFIVHEYGPNYLPEASRFYKTKSKVAQEAHEAIRPTKVEIRNQESGISRDEEKLYELIWKRFVACQMKEAVFEETKVEISAGNYLLRATGSNLKFDGWKKIYGNNNDEEEGTGNEIPALTIGELLTLLQLLPNQHFTEPPARYTEATLIKTLEEKGIGRPSTYAPIISTIQERQYVEKTDPSGGGRGKKFAPTVLGTTVNDFLVANFAEIVDYDFTAKMEDNLDAIANGEVEWQPMLSEFYTPFEKKLDEVLEKAKRVAVPVEETDEKCEKCGAPLVIRLGKFGKFLACSKFPECKFTKNFVNKTDLKCPECGGNIVIKKTKKGRSFFGCRNYPTCTFAAWRRDEIKSKT
ncbi:MAG: type I DNA topoisomerase [Patescibacteria group bacterium]|nr:type I DNA topoisomerase [Patescibacteria group bacterium]